MKENRAIATHTLRIATRQSPLALWQAHYVRERLMTFWPTLQVELVPMVTQGDVLLDTPLSKVGGKGLFVKELEWALLEERADIAVHSIKDVPMVFPSGLSLFTLCARDDPRDAFVSSHHVSLESLPPGSIVGTSSLRRQCQLKARRPDLIIHDLRGNVGTRLSKLDHGDYDAIILAVAGLKRLGLTERINYAIPPEQLLPAVGQGAIGIECRLNDHQTQTLLMPLNNPTTVFQISAERAMNSYLEGGCQVPIAGYAQLDGDQLWLRALVGAPDGSKIIYAQRRGLATQAEQLGIVVAKELLTQGADEILSSLLPSEKTP